MTAIPDRPGIRRLQAAALVAAPLAGLATTLVFPATPLDVRQRLEVLAGNALQTQAAHLLTLLTIVCFVPAVAGMYRLLQPHRARAAAIGIGLVSAGLLGWSGTVAVGSAELALARALPLTEAAAAAQALQASVVANVMLAMFLLCTFSGLVTIAVALWRARVVPGWVAAAVSVAVATEIVASSVTTAVVATWALLVLSFGQMARVRSRTFAAVQPAPEGAMVGRSRDAVQSDTDSALR